MTSDASACCQVINAAIEDMDGLNDAARELVRAKNVASGLDAEIRGWYTLVYERDGRCVAVGALDGTEIRRLYVRPDAQASGVGEAMMDELEAEAMRRAEDRVSVEAAPSSVSFYARRGYVAEAEQSTAVGEAKFCFVPMRCSERSDSYVDPRIARCKSRNPTMSEVFGMRRLTVVVCLVATCLFVLVEPAGASDRSLNREVSGPFTGTSVFERGSGCAIVRQTFDAMYTTKERKTGHVHLDGCVTVTLQPPISFAGSFTVTSPRGGTLSGTVTGEIASATPGPCNAGIATSLNFSLLVVHGTRHFKHASGGLMFAGTWCSSQTPGVAGPISGVLTGNIT